MDLVELLKEAGPLAYLALAFAGLGSMVGLVGLLLLVTRSAATLIVGSVTLLCAVGAAGAGMLGTVNGKRQVSAALSAVDSRVDQERIRRIGYREAQSASMVGFAASLLPGLLGALGAVAGARLRKRPPRLQGGVLEVAADEGAAPLVMAGVFVALAALASAGALAMARAPIPPGVYPFSDFDQDSWRLAGALEDVSKDPARGCVALDEALMAFWKPAAEPRSPALRDEWPRRFARQPDPSLDEWKLKADLCARRLLDATDAEEAMSRDELLTSPLLRDEAVRQELLARERSAETGKPATIEDLIGPRPSREPVIGQGTLPKEVIRQVIRKNLNAVRFCYERGLATEPTLAGKLTVRFVISPQGTVSSAEDSSATEFPSAAVRDCALARFKAMVFPPPQGGGQVVVSYPLIFKAAD